MKDLTSILAMLALVASSSLASAGGLKTEETAMDDCEEQSKTDDDACVPAIPIAGGAGAGAAAAGGVAAGAGGAAGAGLAGLGALGGTGLAIGISALALVGLAASGSGSHSGSH